MTGRTRRLPRSDQLRHLPPSLDTARHDHIHCGNMVGGAIEPPDRPPKQDYLMLADRPLLPGCTAATNRNPG
jgi:hypothetical protein